MYVLREGLGIFNVTYFFLIVCNYCHYIFKNLFPVVLIKVIILGGLTGIDSNIFRSEDSRNLLKSCLII